ncbi:hypothetical protein HAX54_004523, partial [Datura stramonium]|nr:hypothetical protein [Datura stramonium]
MADNNEQTLRATVFTTSTPAASSSDAGLNILSVPCICYPRLVKRGHFFGAEVKAMKQAILAMKAASNPHSSVGRWALAQVVVATSATSNFMNLGPVLTICVVISSMKSCVATCTSCSSSMPYDMGTFSAPSSVSVLLSLESSSSGSEALNMLKCIMNRSKCLANSSLDHLRYLLIQGGKLCVIRIVIFTSSTIQPASNSWVFVVVLGSKEKPVLQLKL